MDKSPLLPRLHIQLLCRFSVCLNGEPINALHTPGLQSLLAYLALHGTDPLARRHLAFQLWPDSSEDQALTNLRKHLKFLCEALPDADQLLSAARFSVRWIEPTVIHSDALNFGKR